MNILRSLRVSALVAGVAAVFAGDVVVDTIADSSLSSRTAEAQGRGGRGGGMRGMGGMREIRELLEPSYSRRDMPLFVEQLSLTDGQRAVNPDPELRQQLAQMTPMGRLGRPEDIAKVAAFLAGPESRWVTGQMITASGGL